MRKDWDKLQYKYVVDKISTTKHKIKQKDYLQRGQIPIIDQGKEVIGGYTNDETRILKHDLPLLVFGDHTKVIKLINFCFAPGADGTKVLKPRKFVCPKYIAFLTEILVFKIKDKGYARHYQHIEKQELPIAPLPEQRAIVAKLEQLFSKLDNSINNLKSAKNKLEIYRQAVLKKAFEGKLITKEPTDDGDTYNIQKAAEPQANYDLKSDINKLPEGWKETQFEKVMKLSKEKYKPENEEDIFYIGLEHIGKGSGRLLKHAGLAKIRTLKNKFYQNQILYGKLRPYLNKVYLAQEEGVCSTDILVFSPTEELLPKYIYWYMLSKKFVNEMSAKTSGVNLPRVSTKNILKHKLILPISINEQKEIVKEIESRFSVCDKLEESINQSLEKAEALRQSILKKAFEGELLSDEEIEACKKEPDWESAEKLLERIKKEK